MFDLHIAVEHAVANKTDADRKKWKEFQWNEAEKFWKVNVHSAVSNKIIIGSRAIKLAKTALAHKLTDEQTESELERYAEGLYLTGEIEQAIEMSPCRKEVYQATLDAINVPSDKRCNCPKQRYQTWFTREQILYAKDVKVYDVMFCSQCTFVNAI
jgi:hypothetical protein